MKAKVFLSTLVIYFDWEILPETTGYGPVLSCTKEV